VLNPAVATGLLVAGEMDRRKWVFYVVAELIGAVFGALLAGGIEEKCFLPKENPEMTCLADYSHSNTGPGCAPDIQPDAYFRVFVRESVGTFILVSTVFATAIAKPGFGIVAPMAIGAAIFIDAGVDGGMTGCAHNPARFFGPALAFGCRLGLFWLYWTAELFGAVSAALLYKHVFMLPSMQVTITRTTPKEFCQERQLEEVAN
jgi:glycerol uptake facilitator-like aquaporin